jgi:hypothetical protein
MPSYNNSGNADVHLGKIFLKVTDNGIPSDEIEYDITKGDLHLDLVSRDATSSCGDCNEDISAIIGDLNIYY